MKTKLLSLVLAGALVAVATWAVARNDSDSVTPHVQDSQSKTDIPDFVPQNLRDTVDEGLEYLVKHQHDDGHWEGDDGKHPVAMTGLVGLALLVERSVIRDHRNNATYSEAKYSANIKKAADWLVGKSQPQRDGLIYSDHPSETARYMQGHGLATLFLAGTRSVETDPTRRDKIGKVLFDAVNYVVKAQSTQRGWYDTSKVEGHDLDSISATAIQIQALQAAANVGFPVPYEAINDAKEYMIKTMQKNEGKDRVGRRRALETAAALAGCLSKGRFIGIGDPPPGTFMNESGKKWLEDCKTEVPLGRNLMVGRDELAHYYYA